MRRPLFLLTVLAILGLIIVQDHLPAPLLAHAQVVPVEPHRDPRLPSGKSQKEEILKADHKKSLDDASELMQLSEDLKIELEKNDRHVLSVSTLKKLDDMEKLVKRIRSRLKRY